VRAAVLTVSDGVTHGTREDLSGDLLAELLAADGYDVERQVVPDEATEIAAAIVALAESAAVVLTTGGTGFAPRDQTPEATRSVIEREAPGLAEAMRLVSPHGRLSRGVAGIRGRTIICNTPGSPKGTIEQIDAVIDVLSHAMRLLADEPTQH
jgi:molybdopterin adenylyltransferase